MKKLLLLGLLSLSAAPSIGAEASLTPYQLTALNTPCAGVGGEIAFVQACSTNATGVVNISSVTDLSVGGRLVSFTNQLATVTLTNGVGTASPGNAYVAPRQKVIVSGSAFPGGSAIIWVLR